MTEFDFDAMRFRVRRAVNNHTTKLILAGASEEDISYCKRALEVQKYKQEVIPVGSHGFVRLNDCMGTDASIPSQARISYITNKKTAESRHRDKKLLRFLMYEKHFSPFAAVQLKLHYKMPLALVAQWCRIRGHHRSEMSARYSIMPDECIVVDQWRVQSAHNKQVSEGVADEATQAELVRLQAEAYEFSRQKYQEMLALGAPREQARFVLPVGQYTELIMTINLGDLMRQLVQRLHPHTQSETRDYAVATAELVKSLFPIAYEAFCDYQLQSREFSGAEWEMLCYLADMDQPYVDWFRTASPEERQSTFSQFNIMSSSERVGFMKKLDVFHLIK